MLRGCLDEESFEWYHSVFCFHHPKRVGPTYFQNSPLVWINFESPFSSLCHSEKRMWVTKTENRFHLFSKLKNWVQWQASKFNEVVGPFASALSHPERLWVITVVAPLFHFHFPLHGRASSTTEPNNPKPSNSKSTKHRPSSPKPSQLHQHN